MTTSIQARCPACGDVELDPHDIVLVPVPDAGRTVGPRSVYRFDCPGCGDSVEKRANEQIATLLRTAGVQVDDAEAEARARHPAGRLLTGRASRSAALPITHDDILDFHQLLEREDWFDQLVAANLTGMR